MPIASTQSARTSSRRASTTSCPAAALPGGEIELTGVNLGPFSHVLPAVLVDGLPAHVLMSRPGSLALRVPDQAGTGLIEVRNPPA
jgi:hypothetical protein